MNAVTPPEEWKTLVDEKSLRGEVIRLAVQRMQAVEPNEQELVREATELLLARFAGSPEADQ